MMNNDQSYEFQLCAFHLHDCIESYSNLLDHFKTQCHVQSPGQNTISSLMLCLRTRNKVNKRKKGTKMTRTKWILF